jgi:hypothetical protein
MAAVQRVGRPRIVRLALAAVVAVLLGLALAWAVTPGGVHAADAPATPGKRDLDAHPWGERGCTLPGAAVDSVSGLFDFRHACTHHDGCYLGLDRMGDAAAIDRVRCDELFRTDLFASCEHLHGTSQNWRALECRSTADAYHAVARSFGRTHYAGTGDAS